MTFLINITPEENSCIFACKYYPQIKLYFWIIVKNFQLFYAHLSWGSFNAI